MEGKTVYEILEELIALPEEVKRKPLLIWDGYWANAAIAEKIVVNEGNAFLRIRDDE